MIEMLTYWTIGISTGLAVLAVIIILSQVILYARYPAAAVASFVAGVLRGWRRERKLQAADSYDAYRAKLLAAGRRPVSRHVFKSQPMCTRKEQQLQLVEGVHWVGDEDTLYGYHFKNCRFTNCILHAVEPYKLEFCKLGPGTTMLDANNDVLFEVISE